jgi:hypothetical protein
MDELIPATYFLGMKEDEIFQLKVAYVVDLESGKSCVLPSFMEDRWFMEDPRIKKRFEQAPLILQMLKMGGSLAEVAKRTDCLTYVYPHEVCTPEEFRELVRVQTKFPSIRRIKIQILTGQNNYHMVHAKVEEIVQRHTHETKSFITYAIEELPQRGFPHHTSALSKNLVAPGGATSVLEMMRRRIEETRESVLPIESFSYWTPTSVMADMCEFADPTNEDIVKRITSYHVPILETPETHPSLRCITDLVSANGIPFVSFEGGLRRVSLILADECEKMRSALDVAPTSIEIDFSTAFGTSSVMMFDRFSQKYFGIRAAHLAEEAAFIAYCATINTVKRVIFNNIEIHPDVRDLTIAAPAKILTALVQSASVESFPEILFISTNPESSLTLGIMVQKLVPDVVRNHCRVI